MTQTTFPRLFPMGLNGLSVSFSDRLDEAANRACLAFCARLTRESWAGVEEVSTALCSVFVRFDPQHLQLAVLEQATRDLLDQEDWYRAPLPEGRRLWRIPTVFGGEGAPQLAEAAALAGVSSAQAIAELSAQPVRVLALGYAPGQPYLGTLPENWDLPRQTDLTRAVPVGALVVAVRQFVLFATKAPTGWRHVGETGFRCFRPDSDAPFALRPGDECLFTPVGPEVLAQSAGDPNGGAVAEALP